MRSDYPPILPAALAAIGLLALCLPPAHAGVTTLVSAASDGSQGNKNSWRPSISEDGSYVAFESDATNLVPGDTNAAKDIFLRDRPLSLTTRASVDSSGDQGYLLSINASISEDGNFVAFESDATNLVFLDLNFMRDIFVHNRLTAETTRVSVASDGTQANYHAYNASISADGRYVAFQSAASNLVPGDTNGYEDVFVHDRQTGATTRVSVRSDGGQAEGGHSQLPAISGDGRYVAFQSYATNLVPGDTNGQYDIFVHDRQTWAIGRVSVASDGTQANGESAAASISADGRYVTFASFADNLVDGDTNTFTDIFVRDRQTLQTTRVSVDSAGGQSDGTSYCEAHSCISADGRYVTFDSDATTLVAADTNGSRDVFVHDRQTAETTRVSVGSDGTQGNDDSLFGCITADGRAVAFHSYATNLITDDTNGLIDVFVHDRWGAAVCCFSYDPAAPDDQTPVQFTDCSTHPYAQVVAWDWDFGDGGTSTEQNPSHSFAAGTYTVCLTVTDDLTPPESVTCCQTVTVTHLPMCCFSHAPATPMAGAAVQFTDCSTQEPPQTIVGWDWDFGDGGVSTDQHPTHTYAGGGCFEAALTVTNSQGLSETCSTCVPVRSETEVPFCDAGWHMVAQPHSGDHALADVIVRDDWNSLTLPFCDATGAWVMNPLFYYDIELMGYGLCGCDGVPPPSHDHTLRMGHGYWLYTFQDYLTLVFP